MRVLGKVDCLERKHRCKTLHVVKPHSQLTMLIRSIFLVSNITAMKVVIRAAAIIATRTTTGSCHTCSLQAVWAIPKHKSINHCHPSFRQGPFWCSSLYTASKKYRQVFFLLTLETYMLLLTQMLLMEDAPCHAKLMCCSARSVCALFNLLRTMRRPPSARLQRPCRMLPR